MEKNKKLSKQETYELILKVQKGDRDAEEYLYVAYTPLIKKVTKIAIKKNNKNIEYEDLFQSASEYFIRCLRRFDVNLNYELSTYIYNNTILFCNVLIKQNNLIKISRKYTELYYKIKKYSEVNKKTIEESCGIFNLDIEKYKRISDMLDMNNKMLSLNYKIEKDDEQELLHTLPDDKTINELDIETIELVQSKIKELKKDEQEIVKFIFYKELTTKETADKMGVSICTIFRKKRKILDKIKASIGDINGF